MRLPIDGYVVVGGGSMAAHDIRETQDIDIVCTEAVYRSLENAGWPYKARNDGKPSLKRGDIEIFLDVNAGDFQPTTQELIDRSVIIDGVRFASLMDVRSFKKVYGREKDLQDIAAIDEHLQKM